MIHVNDIRMTSDLMVLASIRGISRRRRSGLCNLKNRVFGIDHPRMTSRHGLSGWGMEVIKDGANFGLGLR